MQQPLNEETVRIVEALLRPVNPYLRELRESDLTDADVDAFSSGLRSMIASRGSRAPFDVADELVKRFQQSSAAARKKLNETLPASSANTFKSFLYNLIQSAQSTMF